MHYAKSLPFWLNIPLGQIQLQEEMILLTQVLSGKEYSLRGGTEMRSVRKRGRRGEVNSWAVRIEELGHGDRREKEQRQVRMRAQRVGQELTGLFGAWQREGWWRPRDWGMVGLNGGQWSNTRARHRVRGQQHQQLHCQREINTMAEQARQGSHIHSQTFTSSAIPLCPHTDGPTTTIMTQHQYELWWSKLNFGLWCYGGFFWLTTFFSQYLLKKNLQYCSLQRLQQTSHIGGKEDNPQENHLELASSCPTPLLLITQWETWMGSKKHSGPTISHPLPCSYAKLDQKHNVRGREKLT